MKKDKTDLKIILAFIMGAIIFGSIGVYATIKIQADEIGYGEPGKTVADALDDLYDKADKGLNYDNIKSNGFTFQSRGTDTVSTIDLTTGKYICSYNTTFGGATTNSSYSVSSTTFYPTVTGCDSLNNIKSNIKAVAASSSNTKNASNVDVYNTAYGLLYTFTCEVNSNKTVTITHTTSTASNYISATAIINCIEYK